MISTGAPPDNIADATYPLYTNEVESCMDSWTDDEDDGTPFISHEGGELTESIGNLLDSLNPSQVISVLAIDH